MSSEIRLKEHQDIEVSLDATEVALLRQTLGKKLDVYPTSEPGRYLLQAHAHVGFVVLPGERTIVIEPKVPIQTLFALLAAVYDPDKDYFSDTPQDYTSLEALFEFVVRIFVSQVEDILARGILRGYRPVTEDLSAVRGRLCLTETFHSRPALFDRHWCTYSRFTPDVPENRIVRWTSFCLQVFPYRECSLHNRLFHIIQALTDVELDPHARLLFERLEFHRLNDPYQPPLALARLLLDHLAFSGSAGAEPFLAYLIDMNWLFERYMGTVVKRIAPKWGLTIYEQYSQDLDTGKKVAIRPDVVVYRHNLPLLVIDAKYKLDPHQADLYQMLAYCHALGLSNSVLVHPASEQAPQDIIFFRGPGNMRTNYLSLDLHGDINELAMQEELFTGQIENLFGFLYGS